MYYILIIVLLVLLLFLYVKQNYFQVKENLEEKPNKIPKIIIQTWKNEEIPSKYLPLIDNVKKHNPEYQYIFFTDEGIDEFLKTNYLEYYKTYKELPIKIQKIDFFRYIAVYHYGGIYLDLDMDGLKNMDEILHHNAVFPVDEYINTFNGRFQRYKKFYNNEQYFLLGQYAFAAEPKNQFIKSLIDNIHNNIHKIIKTVNHNHDDYVYTTTGPDYVSKIYLEYEDKENIHVLDNKKRQYFGDFAQHKYFGSWKKS